MWCGSPVAAMLLWWERASWVSSLKGCVWCLATHGQSPGCAGLRCQSASLATPAHHPGMEVAAYLTEKAHSVSVVELEETPFRRFLGERVGRALMKVMSLFQCLACGHPD